jgi:hypothetical protein
MTKSKFGQWFREQSVKNPASTEYVPPKVLEPDVPSWLRGFSVDMDGSCGNYDAYIRKDGKRVELKDLTDQEKLEVIELLLQEKASEASTAWEISMGDDL